MKNQANWDFANKLSGEVMLVAIHGFLLLSVLFIFFIGSRIPFPYTLVFAFLSLMASVLVVIPVVENKLKKFDLAASNSANI